MILSFLKKKAPKSVGLLVVWEIYSTFWSSYLAIALLTASAFVLQVTGITTFASILQGKQIKYLPMISDDYAGTLLALLLLLLSSLLLFGVRALSVRIMVEYEGMCAGRLVNRFARSGDRCSTIKDDMVLRYISKDCRFGGRIAQEISNLVMPGGVALVAFPVLVYLNYQVTLVVLIAMAITVVPYRVFAKWAKNVSYSFEGAAGMDALYKKNTIKEIKKNPGAGKTYKMPHPDFKKAYSLRLIAAHFGVLVGGFQLAICLAAASAWLIYRRPFGFDPAHMIMYAVVALVAFNQVKSVPKVFANCYLFLAYFQRVFVVLHDLPTANEALPANSLKEGEDITLGLDA
jgi:hypothetical protein